MVSTMVSTSEIRVEHLWRVAITLVFLIQIIVLILAWNTPAIGYESSIYRSTPLIVWIGLITSGITGISLAVVSSAKLGLRRKYLWKIGLLLAFLSYTTLLSLFIIRGYYGWFIGDPATHIGWIKYIINTGYTPTQLHYPLTHIYLSECVAVTSLDLLVLHKTIPLIFGLLCVLFMYVFGKAVFSNSIGAIIVAIISCCWPLGWYLDLSPNHLSNLLMPFALYLIVKYLQKKAWSWNILLITIFMIYPVLHIVPTIFLIIVLLTLWIPQKLPEILEVVNRRRLHSLTLTKKDTQLKFVLLLLIVWCIYYISTFAVFYNTLNDVFDSILLGASDSEALSMLNMASTAQNYGYNVIEHAIKIYSSPLILFTLSLLALPILWREFYTNGRYAFIYKLYGPMAILFVLIAILFVFKLPFSPLRFLTYASMLMVITAAYLILHLLTKKCKHFLFQKTGFKVLCTILLVSTLFLINMPLVYTSPYSLESSFHTSESELTGMTFFFAYRDVEIPVTGILIAPGRYADLLLTSEEKVFQQVPMYLRDKIVPRHFSYDKYYSLSSSYNKETDLLITQRDRLFYVDVFPEMAEDRYSIEDFKRLKIDPTLDHIYSSGELDYIKINGKD